MSETTHKKGEMWADRSLANRDHKCKGPRVRFAVRSRAFGICILFSGTKRGGGEISETGGQRLWVQGDVSPFSLERREAPGNPWVLMWRGGRGSCPFESIPLIWGGEYVGVF